MTQRDRSRLYVISAYIHATHACLALAAFLAPALTLVLAPTAPTVMTPILLLSFAVSVGASLVVAVEFAPTHRLVAWLSRPRRRALIAATVVLIALVVMVLMQDDYGPVTTAAFPLAWALLATAGGSSWSGAMRLAAATVICGILLFTYAAISDHAWQPLTLVVASLLALGVLVQNALYLLAIELDDLRSIEAERAVVTERKRFSGDLHDIQGQHLSLITVEAELVSRLLEAENYSDAATHAKLLQSIAIEALEEMHRVVHANREVTLHEELANAVRVLQSAGIAVTRHIDAMGTLPHHYDRLLGLTVRESITNILKHSQASSCSLEARAQDRDGSPGIALVVTDPGPATSGTVHVEGTGLSTLAQKYQVHGGRLDFDHSQGAQLTVWLPTHDGGPA